MAILTQFPENMNLNPTSGF